MISSLTATPKKFTFDLDLGRKVERKEGPSESAIAEMQMDARAEGYAQGYAEGEHGATAVAARRLADAAEDIGAKAAHMLAALDDTQKANLRDAVELAASIGRKLASHLLARHPAAEIEALIAECMASLGSAPHLVIRCHPDLAEGVRDISSAHMATSQFEGRLVVMGDPDQPVGDCRIEWVDGGLVRNTEAVSAEINNRIAAFLASRGAQRQEEGNS